MFFCVVSYRDVLDCCVVSPCVVLCCIAFALYRLASYCIVLCGVGPHRFVLCCFVIVLCCDALYVRVLACVCCNVLWCVESRCLVLFIFVVSDCITVYCVVL